MKDDTKRRAELADFLRTRRARLHPEQFGLSTPGRRRVEMLSTSTGELRKHF